MNNYLTPNVATLPPSGIRKFFDLVATMKDVISLGVGEPDFVTPWTVRESGIFSLEEGQTMYTSNAGLLELREELSHHLNKTFSLSYDPHHEILITAGASEAVDLVMRAVLGPGDVALVPDPSYVSYAPCAILAGASVTYVPTYAREDFRLRVEDLARVYTPNAKLLVLSYPNNPTGAIMNREDLLPIADFANEHDLLVLADDIYSDLTYDQKHVSFASLPGMRDRTLFVNGFSKSYAMTGWRIGYVAGHSGLIQGMTKIHQYTMLCAPIMGQFAAIEALRSASEAKNDMVTAYDRRRRLMVHGFRQMGLDCFEPLGAFYVFPDISKTGLSSEEFAEQLLKEEKVAVVPGTAFGPSGEGHIRCSYAYSMEQLQEALKRIAHFVERRLTNL
ncbi:aminotransferase class I/II-fold pyridoxal phosphate-dependent enzyme [Desulfosporosinus sp.]|uniref:aminotransferase class I/II-fold pyridoxal phosphate-dependent enzyme n=1 Tax=Desulfosporosinus sp. TaxID=157907 RepID=UPI0025BCDD61|nr:aminotransferase class I/II-fold pyridoxal phosphate-dependent enzyme [Desulfosporosinus sp.]MBC2722731.1 aminotransferase class I/II-fold pyridoxal phosphate-dependent enzyme [Desulfosporosinus sp.]MBC2729057.1 aminotransferase class I/II-fold pyridoxal phosphate-dependent enzyme [Desulfosporosinus sp.]